MRMNGAGAVAYLRFVGIGLLTMLVLGFAMQMLATLRAKARDLYLPRGRTLAYWGIALCIAVGLLLWLAFFHR